MHCRILRQITLKADGHLACDDSTGYKIDLGHVSANPGWRLRDVLRGPVYQHIRSSFSKGQVPWPGTCERCDLLSDGGQVVDTLDHRIDILVEPTLACGLSCACCIRRSVIAQGRDTSSLDAGLLRRVVDSCRADNIAIDQVNYIGQGEPLLHGDFPSLFEAVRQGAPEASQIINTTGNVDYRRSVGDARPDRIVVSCDGTRQRSYERYRRGGSLEQVMQFMRDCKRFGQPGILLEWKYILFEFNDSDEELREAQLLADDMGVDSLLFIVTNSKWRSTRFTIDSLRELPLTSRVARVNPSAAMNAVACECLSVTHPPDPVHRLGCIDVCNTSVGKMLNVEGWVLDPTGRYVDKVELWLDGMCVATAGRLERRPDVPDVYPFAEGPRCGFIFRVPIDPQSMPATVEVRAHGASGTTALGGAAVWITPTSLHKRRTDMPSAPLVLEAPIRLVRDAATGMGAS